MRLTGSRLALVLSALALVFGGSLMAEDAKAKNIVETAVGAKDFKTLVAAVKAAGLVETLSGKGPFTVFAPTDEAFAKLGDETIQAVLKDKEKLTAILKLHVVAGRVMAKDVVKLTEAETLNGKLPIKVEGDTVMIGKAKVLKTDIDCENGVIHVIDTVLLPSGK